MARYEVVRKTRKGSYVSERLNTLREVKSLVVGTSNLQVYDNQEMAYCLSENIGYWARRGNSDLMRFCRGILKASYAKVS